MKKAISFFLIFFSLFALNTSQTKAKDFETSLDATFTANTNQTIEALLNFDITNLSTDVYTKSFTLKLENVNPQNAVAIFQEAKIPLQITTNGSIKELKIEFPEKVVGKGNSQKFQIQFTDAKLIKKTGNIWEISLPKLSESNTFDQLQIQLRVPKSFGPISSISPNPQKTSSQTDMNIYSFDQNSLDSKAISASFGNLQAYSLNLTYHLENPLSSTSVVDIAIPPDTAFQKVSYAQIDPQPQDIKIDQDGNWIATFKLKSKEKIDIKVVGTVQVFLDPQKLPQQDPQTIQNNTLETQYWQTTNSNLKLVANSLNGIKDIYDFVVNTLTYNYNLLNPTTKRLGALSAYLNPTQATCMEFTDLFITLARAKGIPAREINGFAYTQNSKLEPLSLVADVLHAWPEYYDKDKKLWIPVDPTWENTSGKAMDYFNNFDLKHVTFAIHGTSADKPYPAGSYKLGSTPKKDVFVNITKFSGTTIENVKIMATPDQKIPIGNRLVKVALKNNGPEAIYDQSLTTYFDNSKKQEINISYLLPFQTQEFQVYIPYGLTGKEAPEEIKINFANQEITFQTNKNFTALIATTTFFITIFTISIIIFLRFHK